MNRITQLDPETATSPVKQLFDGVQLKLGIVPNLIRVLGNSPTALKGYLNLNAALGGGSFDPKLREQIALAVAESNQCGYCLSAHSFIGHQLGLTEEDIADADTPTRPTEETPPFSSSHAASSYSAENSERLALRKRVQPG